MKQYHIQWAFSGHRLETVAKVTAKSLQQAVEAFAKNEGLRLYYSRLHRRRRKGASWSMVKFLAKTEGILIKGFAVIDDQPNIANT